MSEEGGICQEGGRLSINTMEGLLGADGEGFQGEVVAGGLGGAVAWMGLVLGHREHADPSALSRRWQGAD